LKELGKKLDGGRAEHVAETSVNAWDYATQFTPSPGTPMEELETSHFLVVWLLVNNGTVS